MPRPAPTHDDSTCRTPPAVRCRPMVYLCGDEIRQIEDVLRLGRLTGARVGHHSYPFCPFSTFLGLTWSAVLIISCIAQYIGKTKVIHRIPDHRELVAVFVGGIAGLGGPRSPARSHDPRPGALATGNFYNQYRKHLSGGVIAPPSYWNGWPLSSYRLSSAR